MKQIINLEKLSPDLYLRYLHGFEIIKKNQKNEPCIILDVGGRAGIMGDFIKQEKLPYKLIVIDSLPDDAIKQTTCSEYIQQDFIKFSTKIKFDYIVTFDVLEHVYDREAFIRKCLSLGDILILTAPFKAEAVDFSEKVVDEYFLKYLKIHHPWLREHFKQGLPKFSWLEKLLGDYKIEYKVFESNNVKNWVNFMLPNLLPAFFSVDTKKLDEINQFYNKNYNELGDKFSPAYRKLLVTFPKGKNLIFDKEFKDKKVNIQKKIIIDNMVIDFFTDTIKYVDKYADDAKHIMIDEFKIEREEIENEIKLTVSEIDNQTKLLDQLINSTFYKVWRIFINFKRIFK